MTQKKRRAGMAYEREFTGDLENLISRRKITWGNQVHRWNDVSPLERKEAQPGLEEQAAFGGDCKEENLARDEASCLHQKKRSNVQRGKVHGRRCAWKKWPGRAERDLEG